MGMSGIGSIDRLWTVEEVSVYLGPPVSKVGRHLRYDPAAVKAWVASAA
jgi:hypothetical protein